MKIAKLETFDTEFVFREGHGGYRGGGLGPDFDLQRRYHGGGVPPPDRAACLGNGSRTGGHAARINEREHKYPGSYLRRAQTGLDTASGTCGASSRASPWPRCSAARPGKVRAYASSMKRDITPEERRRGSCSCATKRASRLQVARGRGMRARPGRMAGADRGGHSHGVARLGDIDKLVDGNSCYSPKRAIEVGRMLEDNGIGHFEEPCPYWEFDQTRRGPREALSIDVAGGEQDCELTAWQTDDRAQGRRYRAARHHVSGRHAAARWRSAGWAKAPACRSRPMRRTCAW